MYRTIVTISAALLLAASGAVHGIWTDRWTQNPEQVTLAADHLKQLPTAVGKWDGVDVPMDTDPKLALEAKLTAFLGLGASGEAPKVQLKFMSAPSRGSMTGMELSDSAAVSVGSRPTCRCRLALTFPENVGPVTLPSESMPR